MHTFVISAYLFLSIILYPNCVYSILLDTIADKFRISGVKSPLILFVTFFATA